MKIVVTGANGYLGRGVVKSILNMGHEVVAVDISTQYVPEGAHKIECNMFEVDNPFELFGRPDVLLHMAWRDGFVHYSDAHIEDLHKHYAFIKRMLEGGLKQIAIMGSMHEVGFWEGSIDENTPCHPVTPYGISKNALRDLTQMLAKQHDVIFQWLRGYYIVGNTKVGNSIFSKLVTAVEDGKKEFPFTTGQNQYDFVDYEEFCDKTAAVVVQSTINGIVEICSGRPEKLADRVERFIRENNYDIELVYGAFPERPYDSAAIWGNARKINEILNK